MEKDFLVISDVHLEGKSAKSQQFILDTINEKLDKYHQKGITPVVICPGDIHNNDKGLPWLSQIKARVIYLCGNHEFWENDYSEVIENISKNCPDNVNFLHNDLTIIGDNLYVGGTLWSDLGKSLNPDLLHYARDIMNDNHSITYKKWFEKEENIEKYKKLYQHAHYANEAIDKKKWNVLAEREENEKTIEFFNSFADVMEVLKLVSKIDNNLKQSLTAWQPISQEEYEQEINNLYSYKKEKITYKDWLKKNQKNMERLYVNTNKATELHEKIFNKLKHHDVEKLKTIMLSHHLPFLEERLIGRQEWFDEKINQHYFNDLPDALYSLRKGVDYPYHNYFYRISKGEMSKDESITQVIHYCNDGARNLNPNIFSYAYCWVHGHEHAYNYEDVLKGMKIVTNPLAHSMAVFSFENNKIGLSKTYKSYHEIKDEKKEVEELKDSFLRKVSLELDKKDFKNAVNLWALKSFDWKNYSLIYNYIEKLNKKLLKLLLKNPQWEESMTETENLNVNILIDAINLSIQQLEKLEKRLNEGASLRSEEDFSFDKKYGHAFIVNNLTHYFKAFDFSLIKINRNNEYYPQFEYQMWMRDALKNVEYLELNKKELNKTKMIIDKFKFKRLNEINKTWLAIFEKAFKTRKYINQYQIDQNLYQKLHDLKLQYQPEKLKQEEEKRKKELDF